MGGLFQRGALGHVGHDGCTAGERANRYGTWHKAYGENLAYFCWNGASTCLRRQPCTCGGVGSLTFRRPASCAADDVVVSWLVDDGVPKRGHRVNLLREGWRVCGVASGDHKNMESMYIALFADAYEDA